MANLARRDPTMRVVDYPVLFATGIVFNTHRPPFDDARVRRAVSLSINRERVVAAALAGFGTPAAGPVPPENPLALDGAPEYNPAKADALLDATGWRRGSDGWRSRGTPLDFELLTVGSGDNAVEQLVQADLAARGIRVRIRQMELGAFLARARSPQKDFDALITGVPGDLSLSYVSAMLETAQHGGALDYAGFSSKALDALFVHARSAPSDRALREAWLDAQRVMQREVPIAWLYHARGLQGVSARMQGVSMDLRGELAGVTRWTIGAPRPAAGAVVRR
jgi:peptide/nickel transport system substrate-binding protein